MTRIDHAAEARTHIQWVNEWQVDEGDTPETHLASALMAQAHATLALVEQQCIANLIALATEDLTGLGGAARHALGERYGSDAQALRPDIAAALGIEAAS